MWARGSLPRYSWMSTKVGLLTSSREAPRPAATPRTREVFPAPNGPYRASVSPPSSAEPSAQPSRSVSRGEKSFNSHARLDAGDVRRDVRTDPVGRRRLAGDCLERIGDVGDEIAGEHTGLSELLSRKVASCSMKVCCGAGCLPGLDTLGEQTDNHPGQDISRPGGRHSGVTCGTDGQKPVWPGDYGACAFQNQKHTAFAGEAAGGPDAIGIHTLRSRFDF